MNYQVKQSLVSLAIEEKFVVTTNGIAQCPLDSCPICLDLFSWDKP